MEQNKNIGPKYAIRLADLREWHVVTATCFQCQRQARLPATTLAWERPPYTYLTELERKLRCTQCGNRQGNTLSVSLMARD
jgi:hypothetical protein